MEHSPNEDLSTASQILSEEASNSATVNKPTRIGLGLAVLSLFFSFYGLVAIAALVFSFYGLHKTKDEEKRGQKLALFGLGLGLASFLYSFAMLLIGLRLG